MNKDHEATDMGKAGRGARVSRGECRASGKQSHLAGKRHGAAVIVLDAGREPAAFSGRLSAIPLNLWWQGCSQG